MIERFDLDAKGQADPNGAWFWVDEVEHLLRPPTHGKDGKPIHYTPIQWTQWFVDNKLPAQEWTGPVWAKHCRCPEFEIYERESNIEIYFHESWTVLIANEAGEPPDDYACES